MLKFDDTAIKFCNKAGINYLLEWQITVPDKNKAVISRSILNDREFDAILKIHNACWKMSIQVTGTCTEQGLMELNSYGNSKKTDSIRSSIYCFFNYSPYFK